MTIQGIVVEVLVKSTNGIATDFSVKLAKGGTVGGTEHATSTAISTTLGWITFGSSVDLWGQAWTPADINAAGFGVGYAVSSASVDTIFVDAVRITVYYTFIDITVSRKRTRALRDRFMGYLIKQSTTAQPLMFLMIDSTDHVTGKTALSPTVTISKNGAAFAAPAGAVSEVANGWYKVAGNATDSNTLGPLILHATATGADPSDEWYDVVSFDPQDAVRMGQTALPNAAAEAAGGLFTRGTGAGQINQDANGRIDSNLVAIKGTASAGAAGYVGLDWSQINAPTTTVALSGTSILLTPGTGAGQISLTSGAVTVGTNNDKTSYRLTTEIRANTAQAGAASSITLDAAASATNELYKGEWIVLTGGTGAGQSRLITAYNGTTKVATVSTAWATNPDATSTFTIIPAGDIINVTGGVSGVTFPSNFSSLSIDASGNVSLGKILGTSVTEGAAGRLATAFKTFFDVATPTGTVNLIPQVTLVSTVTTLTGNTPQSGDAFARIGALGAGLTALGDTRLAFLDAAVSSRLSTAGYTAPLSASATANAVLDATMASHVGAGTVGEKINAAASAGDPWTTALPGAYTAGQAGYIVGHNLDATMSSRSTYAGGAVASVTGNVGGNVIGSVGSVAGAVGSVTGGVGGNVSGSVASVVADVSITQVGADKVWASTTRTLSDKTGFKLAADGLDVISTTAPTGVATNFREMIVQNWRRWFKKSTMTASQLKTYADDGATVLTTQNVTDDGTTQTQGASS